METETSNNCPAAKSCRIYPYFKAPGAALECSMACSIFRPRAVPCRPFRVELCLSVSFPAAWQYPAVRAMTSDVSRVSRSFL